MKAFATTDGKQVEMSPTDGALELWSSIVAGLRQAGYEAAGPEYVRLSRFLKDRCTAELLADPASSARWAELRRTAAEAASLLGPVVNAATLLAELPTELQDSPVPGPSSDASTEQALTGLAGDDAAADSSTPMASSEPSGVAGRTSRSEPRKPVGRISGSPKRAARKRTSAGAGRGSAKPAAAERPTAATDAESNAAGTSRQAKAALRKRKAKTGAAATRGAGAEGSRRGPAKKAAKQRKAKAGATATRDAGAEQPARGPANKAAKKRKAKAGATRGAGAEVPGRAPAKKAAKKRKAEARKPSRAASAGSSASRAGKKKVAGKPAKRARTTKS